MDKSKIEIQVIFQDSDIQLNFTGGKGNCWAVNVIPKIGEYIMLEDTEYPVLRIVHELDHRTGVNIMVCVGLQERTWTKIE